MLMPRVFGENLFDNDWMDFPFRDEFWGKKSPFFNGQEQNALMKTDIRDAGDHYELDVDLPGVKKEDIKLQLKDGYLTMAATHNADKDEKDEHGKYIRRERYVGTVSRSFYVGDALKESDVHAQYENGTLKLSLPKPDQKAVPENRYIAIEG